MLMKQDREFDRILDDPTKMESGLAELTRQRRWSVVTAAALTTLIYVLIVMIACIYISSVSTKNPFGTNPPTPMLLMPSMFLPLLIIHVAKAVSAHGEIRTLLLFGKLRQTRLDD